MTYDFDAHIDRRGTHTVKWDYESVARAREANPELLPMWVADMDLPSPEPVVRALRERAEHPVYGYTLVPDSLLNAFMEWHRRRHGTPIHQPEIISVTGVMPAVEAAVATFTEPGDGVVIQTPVYFPFYDAIGKQGRTVVRNPLKEDAGRFSIDLDNLRECFRDGAKMLLLCSPHNPVGRVWTRRELKEMATICAEENTCIVSDEIHCDVLLQGNTFTSVLSLGEEVRANSLVTTSPSKTFNIAGSSCAQAILPDEERRKRFKRAVMARGIWMPNLFGVAATEAAYAEGAEWLDQLLPYLTETDAMVRRELAEPAPQVRVSPLEGTYIAWLDFREVLAEKGREHGDLRGAIEAAGVWPSDGKLFGEEGIGFQRLNIAAPRATVREAVRRIAAAVHTL